MPVDPWHFCFHIHTLARVLSLGALRSLLSWFLGRALRGRSKDFWLAICLVGNDCACAQNPIGVTPPVTYRIISYNSSRFLSVEAMGRSRGIKAQRGGQQWRLHQRSLISDTRFARSRTSWPKRVTEENSRLSPLEWLAPDAIRDYVDYGRDLFNVG